MSDELSLSNERLGVLFGRMMDHRLGIDRTDVEREADGSKPVPDCILGDPSVCPNKCCPTVLVHTR